MGLSRRIFTKEFKLAAVRRLEQGVSIGEVARALEVNANVLHRWRREFRQGPGNVFPGNGKQRWSEGRIAELERKIGQQALELDFLKGCLQRIEEQRMLQALTGKPRSTGRAQEEMKANRGLSIERMVKLGRVSRSGFYRFQTRSRVRIRDMDLRDAIQRIALEWPSYGRPRITAELRRRGWRVNPKRVYRLMREDNLAVRAEAEVRRHDRFQPRAQSLSEPGARHDPDRRPISCGGLISHTFGCAMSSCSWR